jgi:nicotinamidase-related amidase
LVVDVTIDFVGDVSEPILKSIERFPNSCGEEGWASIKYIRELLEHARSSDVPVLYTQPVGGRFALLKHGKGDSMSGSRVQTSSKDHIVAEITPKETDFVIRKERPSAFFGTPLLSYLINMGIDTLIVSGCTTSGCVRATVIDGFSYGYRMFVVEECVFDRGQASHKVNLFDMNAKYATVLPLTRVVDYLKKLRLTQKRK